MLYIVLLLVLAAFGLLIVALTTANTLWAWFSVIISVAAAVLLVLDWVGGRRAKARAAPDETPDDAAEDTPEPPEVPEATPVEETPAEPEPVLASAEPPPPAQTEFAEPTESIPPPLQPEADSAAEPGEEQTDATDLLVVSDLAIEVHVVDEHPRYHLTRCTWLGAKQTIPIPVSEARQLGFTPCARCGPDATLAARHRTSPPPRN